MFVFSKVAQGCLLAVSLLNAATSSAAGQSNVNLVIMPLGDSITAGYNSSTGNGYRQPLQAELTGQVKAFDFVGSQADGTMSDPYNEGHFGYRIDQLASLANGVLNTYKPDLVLLDAGINDLTQGYDISEAPSRLASLIDQILAAEPEATVLVAQLISNPDPTTGSEVITFNNALPAIVKARASAGEHVYLVDMSALTTADINGVHPNDAGYQLMANAWNSAILQVIANGWFGNPSGGSGTGLTGSIYSGLSGLCLDNFGGSRTPSTKADIYACNGTVAQQWSLRSSGQIVNNGLCLDIFGARTVNGTPVQMWSCNGGANQIWSVQNGTLYNPESGRCLDDPGATTTQGTQLQIYDCNRTPAQQWRVPAEGVVTSGLAGKCLDAFGGSSANGTKADSYSCNNTPAQQWEIVNNTLAFDGKCLDINARGTANGTLVQLWTCNGGANQIWVPVNGALMNPASGRCLDVPGGNTTDGIQLDIWTCSEGSNQQWQSTTPHSDLNFSQRPENGVITTPARVRDPASLTKQRLRACLESPK